MLREIQSPPWNQVLQNGALDPKCISTSQPTEADSQEDVENPQENVAEEKHTSKDADRYHSVTGAPRRELREYQKELAENALTGCNTIIYAPTGSGKTQVAIHIMHEHLKKSTSQEGKKVALLARTVPLAIQHYKSLSKYLDKYKVVNITGQSGNSMKLHLVYPHYDVFVMTPMILVNHLTRKYLADLSVFSMLVFDECHHTKKGEPYNTLMYSYLKTKRSKATVKLPQIIGLSASIGIDKAMTMEKAKENILKLCANMDVDKISVVERNIEELKEIVPTPDEKTKQLTERDRDKSACKVSEIMQKLETCIPDYAKALGLGDVVRKAPKDRKIPKYRQWAIDVKRTAMALPLLNEDKNAILCTRALMAIMDYLVDYGVALETLDLVELKDVMVYLEKRFEKFRTDKESTTVEHTFYSYFKELQSFALTEQTERNPNLQVLAETLLGSLVSKGDKSCGIIFVKTRILAEALASWLNTCDIPEVARLNASVFISANVGKDAGGMSLAEQEAAMEAFRSREVRILVATSIAEEGLDIPECNLVIKYNHVGNEVTSVQTRGRSRSVGGESVLLAMENILIKESENVEKIRLMEAAIRNIRAMDQPTLRDFLQRNQEDAYRENQIAEKMDEDRKHRLVKEPFKMVCSLCRQIGVESSNVRLVNGTCRIAVDRNLLDHIKIIPQDQEYHDEVQYVGQVLCMGEPEPGKRCKQQLGKLIRHARNPFVVLAVASFGFKTGSNEKLTHYKQWKKVPYFISDMETEDIDRYLDDKRISTSIKSATDMAAKHQDSDQEGGKMDVTDHLQGQHCRESKREHSASGMSEDFPTKRQRTGTEVDLLSKEGVTESSVIAGNEGRTEDKSHDRKQSDGDDIMQDMDQLDEDLADLQSRCAK